MAVLIDLRDGAGLTQSDKGYRATRIAEVDSLEGSTPSALLLDAMVAVGVPSMGDAHPDITNIKVVEKRTRDTGCTDGNYWAKIEIVYAASSSSLTFETQEPDDDGAAVKAIRGSLVGITVTRDRTGALIKAAKPGTLLDAFEPAERTLPVNKLTPVFILTFKRHEENPPLARVRAALGKVNSGTLGPYAAETLLLQRIDAQPVGAGESYNVTYEFLYSESGHGVEVFYPLKGGQAATYDPGDSGDDPSHPVYDIYETDSFSTLNLTFTD